MILISQKDRPSMPSSNPPIATVSTPHCSNQSARRCRSVVKVPKVRTGSGSQPGRTAATCRVAPMSTAAAWGWTGAMSRAGRECFRRVMAGTSSGPGWRGGAARKNQFPNRDRLGVTTLKSAAARGPSFVSGSGPPKTGRPLPSAADHSAGCFCRHRRNEFRDRLVAHDLSGLCRRDRMLPEVRMARIIDAIGLHQAKKLSCVEAAELLGMSERHFRRLRDAYEAHGAEGIVDRRRGRASGRRAGVDEIEWVIEEFRTRSFDFTAKHFHEAIHGRPMADGTPFSRGYTWTKSVLQVRGLVSKAPKRSAHRKKRARRPLPGLLLFQDGSKHAWLCRRGRNSILSSRWTMPRAPSSRPSWSRRRARLRALWGSRR